MKIGISYLMTKTILILAIAAAFVVGSITTTTMASAQGNAQGDNLIIDALNSITAAITGIPDPTVTVNVDPTPVDIVVNAPQGEQGIQGPEGPEGPQGDQGVGDNLSGCSTNQIMKWDGSQWVCAVDKDTTEPGTIKHVKLLDDANGNTKGWAPGLPVLSYDIIDSDIHRRSIVIGTLDSGSATGTRNLDSLCHIEVDNGVLELKFCEPFDAGDILRYVVFDPPAPIFVPTP